MKFVFDIKLNDEDYLKYNEFVILSSPYGKKSINSMRYLVGGIYVVFSILTLVMNGFNVGGLISLIPLTLICLGMLFAIKPMLRSSIKTQVKNMKATGKMAYSEASTLEFDEESFCEITAENKTENKYSAVERVSILKSGNVYIHINGVMGYIIPKASFESDEKYAEFETFLKEKVDCVQYYKK